VDCRENEGKLGAQAGIDAALAAFAPTSGGKAGCNATAFAGKFIESPARTRSCRRPDDDPVAACKYR